MSIYNEIDPLLQITVCNLVRKIVEYRMFVEVTEGMEPEIEEKFEEEIRVMKYYIRGTRGSEKLYKLLDWS